MRNAYLFNLGKDTYNMKTINIYITKLKKKELNRLMNTYKLSLSTIADIISYWTYYCLNKYSLDNKKSEQIFYNYLERGDKTSIKPKRILQHIIPTAQRHTNTFVSNALTIYLNDEIKDYVTQKGISKYYQAIDKDLKETKEDMWSFNKFTRMQHRFIRENPEYVRKILGDN